MGDDFLEQLEAALDRICQIPESDPAVYRDVRRSIARRFPQTIYDRIGSSRVIITAVFHGRRDPTAWQDRTYHLLAGIYLLIHDAIAQD